jgi:hypothetical protein
MEKVIKTDGDIMKIARQIDSYAEKMRELVRKIEESEHENASEILFDLQNNGLEPLASAVHVVTDNLNSYAFDYKEGYVDVKYVGKKGNK